jgi:hypothetical protein
MDLARRRRIEEECRTLIITLVHHYDRGEAEASAKLFTPDGLWVKSQKPYRGHQEILDSFTAQPATLVLRHVTTNIHVTVHDEKNASAASYYLVFVGHRDSQQPDAELPLDHPGALGEWSDSFVLTDNGWRFTKREGRRIFGRRAAK